MHMVRDLDDLAVFRAQTSAQTAAEHINLRSIHLMCRPLHHWPPTVGMREQSAHRPQPCGAACDSWRPAVLHRGRGRGRGRSRPAGLARARARRGPPLPARRSLRRPSPPSAALRRPPPPTRSSGLLRLGRLCTSPRAASPCPICTWELTQPVVTGGRRSQAPSARSRSLTPSLLRQRPGPIVSLLFLTTQDLRGSRRNRAKET